MCFLRGTAIATSTGEICVEHLRIGDRVRTARGEVLPVRWIGRHSYRCSGSSWNRRVVPIGIARHAIDEKTPHRNLYLSPGHCLLIDGVLIQAVDLVNDVTIAPVAPATDETIDYFHIVLDRHDVILAEGAAAETLRIQAGNHEGFVNFAEFERLYPDRAHARMALVAPIVGYGGRAHLKALLRLAAGRRAAGAREAAERIFEKLARRAERLPG